MQTLRFLSRRAFVFVIASGLLAAGAIASGQPASAGGMLVFFGTYTGGKSTSKGVYVSRLDPGSGALSKPELAAESASPSFLAAHPSGGFLYAVNETGEFAGKRSGAVSAFAIDRKTGLLTALNQQPSEGGGPAHLSVDKAGRNVLVANYGGGSVAVLPIGSDGKLAPASAFVQHTGSSVNPTRQKGPHAHAINLDPDNRFAYVPDLGLDKVLIYRFDAGKGSLTPAEPPFASVTPGAGPRHIALAASGRVAWVINEIDCTITTFTRNPGAGALTAANTVSTLPAGVAVAQGFSTAEVLVHPSGRFLYGSNRGHDSITVFSVDQQSGALTFVQNESTQGRTPRGFGIDPSGAFLIAANQNSNTVVVFRIDAQTGRLTPTGHTIEVGTPVSVEFVK